MSQTNHFISLPKYHTTSEWIKRGTVCKWYGLVRPNRFPPSLLYFPTVISSEIQLSHFPLIFLFFLLHTLISISSFCLQSSISSHHAVIIQIAPTHPAVVASSSSSRCRLHQPSIVSFPSFSTFQFPPFFLDQKRPTL